MCRLLRGGARNPKSAAVCARGRVWCEDRLREVAELRSQAKIAGAWRGHRLRTILREFLLMVMTEFVAIDRGGIRQRTLSTDYLTRWGRMYVSVR